MNLLAQTPIELYDKNTSSGGLQGFGPLGLEQGQDGVSVFATFMSSAVGLITIIGIIWFVFIIVTGALGIVSSGGDKQALESSKKRITNGIIGLVVLVASLFILSIIGKIIGIPNILDIAGLLKALN